MSGQISIASLNCLKCGATLEIGSNISQFNCGYCGAAQVVQRSGGIIALSLIDAIQQVRVGTDKTAAELAIVRLQGELRQVKQQQNGLINEYQADKELEDKKFGMALGIASVVAFILFLVLGTNPNNNAATNSAAVYIIFLVPLAVFASISGYYWRMTEKNKGKLEAQYLMKMRETEEEISTITRRLEVQNQIVNS